ncbi:hypothetical protein Q5425_07330 [Amycolatopsis sp. A133]|uniref:hypothetical protein n=1 Tax=Amycolatopsis sp. A133 TaxID=3064472 RepID=UPI0027F0873A|nr:hypothetical protein [Amycolatopsis sp. A133]MDQ7803536.1 hypothetical protein [Amycolatopsis sp. A133]
MKPRIVSLFAAVLVAMLVSAPGAVAGNWATTYLDPLPDPVQAGQPYTVGYWVLQHGSHPSYGELGPTALVFTPAEGDPVVFPGVALREPAHYATAIAVPHDGSWRVSARQGGFADYEIGTLTLPGRLVVSPPPAPMAAGENQPWGAIRPPAIALNGGGAVQAQPVVPSGAAAAAESPASLGTVLAVAGLVVVAGVALLVGGRRWRRGARER